MPITEADLPDLLTRIQAAELLGVSRATVDRMISARRIDVVRIGNGRGQVRIPKRALLDHINRNVVKAERQARSA
jgi:excisionase family DNA binding protein